MILIDLVILPGTRKINYFEPVFILPCFRYIIVSVILKLGLVLYHIFFDGAKSSAAGAGSSAAGAGSSAAGAGSSVVGAGSSAKCAGKQKRER